MLIVKFEREACLAKLLGGKDLLAAGVFPARDKTFERQVRPGIRGGSPSLPLPQPASATELQLVPGRGWRELEQRACPTRLEVREVGGAVVPGDVQPAVLDAVVEPRAAEDQLPQPVDERLAVDQRKPLPVAHEVAPELAPRLLDHAVGGELDEVFGLVLVQLVVVDQPELEGGRGDALREVGGVEAEAETEKLDHDVVAGAVAGLIVLWTKIGWESLRRRRHPWRVVALAVGLLAVLVALSLLGLKLPRE